jgi:hypothetical protein
MRREKEEGEGEEGEGEVEEEGEARSMRTEWFQLWTNLERGGGRG